MIQWRQMASHLNDARFTQDRQRLVLEAKLKHAQAALDRRVAELLQAREQGAGLQDQNQDREQEQQQDRGGMGREGVDRLVSRRLSLYKDAYSELGKMREMREERHHSHKPFRRPPAVLFRHQRLSAETDELAAHDAPRQEGQHHR